MQLGGAVLGSVALDSVLMAPGTITDATGLHPVVVEINDVNRQQDVSMDSVRVQDTLGQPVQASFQMPNPSPPPMVGDRIRIFYHSEVIFAGTVDKSTPKLSGPNALYYQCECLDYSHILVRRKINRNFIRKSAINLLNSLIATELDGEGITIGQVDVTTEIALVDTRDAKVLDLCRDLAAATGQTFYLDYNKQLQFLSTSIPIAPLVLTEDIVQMEGAEFTIDRETYRNRQTMVATGTPASASESAISVREQRSNDEEIADRASLEGGTGIYEEVDLITHPISNNALDLSEIAIGAAELKLASSGTLRQTLKCQALSYGFRAGQIATVSLGKIPANGTFVVQRVTIDHFAKRLLRYRLEMVASSVQQRAYESWLAILGKGQVTIQVAFVTVAHGSQVFTATGADSWVVPADVSVVTVTVLGASGGGAGGINSDGRVYRDYPNGGPGGKSGKVVSSINVVEGDVLDILVGTHGSGGAGSFLGPSSSGTAGSLSSVYFGAVPVAIANGGGGGHPPPGGFSDGTIGSSGGGSGGIVTVGGGKTGGAGGVGYQGPSAPTDPGDPGSNGQNGKVTITW